MQSSVVQSYLALSEGKIWVYVLCGATNNIMLIISISLLIMVLIVILKTRVMKVSTFVKSFEKYR